MSEVAEQVLRHRSGDAGAAEWLARRSCRLALRTAAAILRSREEAGDIAQEVAVEMLLALPRLRDPEAFDAWVHRITVRITLRSLRRRRAREHAETPLEHAGETSESDAFDLDLRVSARDALGAGLARLPVKQQLALALRYVHDLSDQEIADALECRIGSVHALLSRGRAALRRDPALRELANAASGG